ncbi:endoplasmic reticulum vesicle transporter-domain-containing protein [Amylocystis lapponica]|nr:endoplasmic reticulum vesicle transporter-domain-containing protein [Amylocystis lapponica]
MATTSAPPRPGSPTILDKLDEIVPAPLAQFDAFPKLPATYRARSESRGLLTLFVAFLAFLLVLNDLGEFVWGWPDTEFSVDTDPVENLPINVDLVVNMPCQYLSIDLRDAVGDRLYLSGYFRRDGTSFDIGQATKLKEHAAALSARQVVAQSRSARGLFAALFRRSADAYRPTYNYQKDGGACRIYGTITAKKVTANLHITTSGHGYQSRQHVDHKLMNLSHVITEFSFGPYFPDITQPLDNSFEITEDPFVAYQYFIHVVPTAYFPARSTPLHTHQYSVTHYTRTLEHHRGTPGIFFKFDLEPLSLRVYQRTTSFAQLMIRCVGVIGGVFVCMGYAVRIGSRAMEAVTAPDTSHGIVAAEASGIGGIGRKRWASKDLRLRPGAHNPKIARQGSGWVVEGGSPYGSYTNTPISASFNNSPLAMHTAPPINNGFSPNTAASPRAPPHSAHPRPTSNMGLGLSSPSFGPMSVPLASPAARPRSMLMSPDALPAGSPFPTAATAGSPYTPTASLPPTPGGNGLYAHFPPTPNTANGTGAGFPRSPGLPPQGPPRRQSWLAHDAKGTAEKAKAD